jgi:hypothetical protein
MATYKSEEDVIEARQKLVSTLQCIRVLMGVGLAFAAGGMLYAIFCANWDRSILAWVTAIIALTACVFASKALDGLSPQLERFVPLAETSRCATVLQLMEYSPQARQIRDEALAAGRQLYVFDYEAIRDAVEEAGRELEASRQAEACRKLHNLTV